MNWNYEDRTMPGTFNYILHNDYNDKVVNVSVLNEHRFAFYYWTKWASLQAENVPSTLVSLDWHQDLAPLSEMECDDLTALNRDDFNEVGIFTAYKLNPCNDGQILAAAYLNLVSKIYVLCKQREYDDIFPFTDYLGKKHNGKVFYTIDELIDCLKKDDINSIYFDIDLDYFTESKDACGGGVDVKLVNDEEVVKTISPHSPLMQLILPKLKGMTIALEPDFCGGLRNSNHLFNILDNNLFYPTLLNELQIECSLR
ncbi:hypothetical protein DEAC_c02380 [Desulfosporosinus acididurans]|uniref:Uncharacterized protein n=1 Tax=Desulfosporosinus acididurans TaxID=476652 RepID=A0A0J1IT52_9FIRM|nr:hypothetical protein [Desulfosporosinus acididurans]KLU67831.1 hypothetical protein DEAC_c02380 [Desulfosporosinus acididurans]